MSRSVEITGWCDGQRIFSAPASNLESFTRCGKSISARSHKKLSEKIERLRWVELQDGTLKCTTCAERESRGENMKFVRQVKNGSE